MKALLLSFWLCGFVSASEICSTPIDEQTVQNHISNLVESQFPELQNVQIKIENFESDAYFLQANLKIKTLLRNAHRRTYVIEVNRKLYDCPPTPAGLIGILAHELHHIGDYLKMNSAEMIVFAAKYGVNKKFHTRYERATDEKALFMDHGQGLIEFRLWIYQWLSPKQLALKKRYYFTPEQIESWMAEH